MSGNKRVIRVRRVGFVEACRWFAARRIGGDKDILVRWRVLRDGSLVRNECEVDPSADVSCGFCGRVFSKGDACFLVEDMVLLCKNCYDDLRRVCKENGTAIEEI
jgi:hypothetical protein